MDYAQTLEYLYTQLPMFTRVGSSAYKEDLFNTIELCNRLNNDRKISLKVSISAVPMVRDQLRICWLLFYKWQGIKQAYTPHHTCAIFVNGCALMAK